MDWPYVLATVLIFGLIIVFHELGHFIVAKAFKMRVHEFSVGFGRPILWQRKCGDTAYSLRAVPLGGFVRIAGMEQGEDVPDGFDKHSIPRRFLVIFSGSFMNFVLAALLFWVIGLTFGKTVGVTNRIERVLPDTPAAKAGLRPGDRIVAVAGKRGKVEVLRKQIQDHPGAPITVVVDRSGREVEFSLVTMVKEALEETESGALRTTRVGAIGIVFESKRAPRGFYESLKVGVLTTYDKTRLMIRVLLATIRRDLPLQVGGPVRIVHEMVEAANVGWVNFLSLSAFLSLNIGFINLFPFPALDGSRLVFLGVEAVRRRPIDPRKEALVHLVGFAILILLIVVVLYQDILYLVRRQ